MLNPECPPHEIQSLRQELQHLKLRLLELETRRPQSRGAPAVGITLAIIILAFVAMADQSPTTTASELRATRVVLVHDGVDAFELAASSPISVGLRSLSPDVTASLQSMMFKDFASLRVVSSADHASVRLQASEAGGLVSVNGKRGPACSIDTATPNGSGCFSVIEGGRRVSFLSADPATGGLLATADPSGKITAVFPMPQAPQTISPRATAGNSYLGCGSGHWINDVSADGRVITLEDDSLWEVDALDRIDTALWLPITNVTVKEDGLAGYVLVNTDEGEIAHARLISR